jgi:hypothetical protein
MTARRWEVSLHWWTPVTADVTVEADNEEEAVDRAWAARGEGYVGCDDELDHAVARELSDGRVFELVRMQRQ